MTHLQILRGLLQASYSVEMSKGDGGYHILVSGNGQTGEPSMREIVDPRLDQAINQLLGLSLKANQPTPKWPRNMEPGYCELNFCKVHASPSLLS